jgi:hypothetical protein
MKISPMMLIDRITFKEIIWVTYSILRNNFFYSDELLGKFSTTFTEEFSSALVKFANTSEIQVKRALYGCRYARFEFTCSFSGNVIREILIRDFHFNNMELKAFDIIVSKHGDRPIRDQQGQPRAYY